MALSFSAGGALARSLAVFSTSARSRSASANFCLSICLRCSAIFLPRAVVCLATSCLSSRGVADAGALPEFRFDHSGTSRITPARRTGTIGTQARRGIDRPNRSVTSRVGDMADRVGDQGPAGGGLTKLLGQGERGAEPLVEPESPVKRHGRLGPVRPGECGDQAGPRPATDRRRSQTAHHSAPGTGTRASFSTPRTIVARARPEARHQTVDARNRCNRNRRQTRPIGLSNSFTARPPSSVDVVRVSETP